MQKRTKIITGVLSATLLMGGGVALANYHPKAPTPQEVRETAMAKDAASKGTLELAGTDTMQPGTYTGVIVDGKANGGGKITFENGDDWDGTFKDNVWVGSGLITYRMEGRPDNVKELNSDQIMPYVDPRDAEGFYPTPASVNGETEPINPQNPDWYAVWAKRPAGIVIYQIIFHEGFRGPGLKAVDVHIFARSNNNENELIQGRDEIISITGSTGKIYNMIGTKRTGVNTNAHYKNFQEQEITQYQDVSVNEKSITSIVVRRDGKNITVKPDKDTKYNTTYAVVPAKVAVTPTKVVTSANAPTAAEVAGKAAQLSAQPSVGFPGSDVAEHAVEVPLGALSYGKLVIYTGQPINPADYEGEIRDGKANGQGTCRWRNPEGNLSNHTWTGNFWNDYPSGVGIETFTNTETGEVYTQKWKLKNIC